MRRTYLWVILLAATAVLASACSPAQPGAVDARPDRAGEEAELAHAQCMRDHGIDWPDPEYIEGEWQARPGQDVDLESPAFLTAESECALVRQEAGPGGGDGADPQERAQLEEEMGRMLEFAACMREQGIDFPDPQFDDTGGISGPAGPNDGDTAAFESARATCEAQTGRSMP